MNQIHVGQYNYVLGQYLKHNTCIVLQNMYCVTSPQCVPSLKQIVHKIDKKKNNCIAPNIKYESTRHSENYQTAKIYRRKQ